MADVVIVQNIETEVAEGWSLLQPDGRLVRNYGRHEWPFFAARKDAERRLDREDPGCVLVRVRATVEVVPS